MQFESVILEIFWPGTPKNDIFRKMQFYPK